MKPNTYGSGTSYPASGLRRFCSRTALALFTVAWTAFAAAEEPVKQPGTGIHVIGDWTITIFDSDGREVASHAFRNALEYSGERLLVTLLTFQEQIVEEASGWFLFVRTVGTVDTESCNSRIGVPVELGGAFLPGTRAAVTRILTAQTLR